MSSSELDSRNIAISMRKSVENLVISSQDAIGQSISQALTFSGVLSQNTQGAPENKSVSRSPSPASRSADCAVETTDNEKGTSRASHSHTEASLSLSETTIHVSHSGGDSLPYIEIPSIVTFRDNVKSGTPNSSRASEAVFQGGRKKKSWYNSLYPTYKSKCDDFKRLFKDLPDDERLIVDYSCALQKDILVHGRLYASQNYLCFYASIFGWETSMTLRWKDVTAITKEKTALVIPNAILVCTETEKNFLTSFSGRDKSYLMLFRIWQNALMDQPVSSQEIWQWVHTCYGEELGFNSEDEANPRFDDQPPVDTSEELVDSSSMDAGEPRDEHLPRRPARARDISPPLEDGNMASQPERRARKARVDDDFIIVQPYETPWFDDTNGNPSVVPGCDSRLYETQGHAMWSDNVVNGIVEIDEAEIAFLVSNGDAEYREEEGGDTLPTDMSDTSDSDQEKPHNGIDMELQCTSSHEGKMFLRQEFPFNIDQMFTMIFTNSKFNLELLAARGTTDYVQAPWQSQGGLECRQVSYTVGLTSGPIGPKEVHVTETQVMNKCSKPGFLYSIDTTGDNAGIPYADHFSVHVHYCLQRVSENVTCLSLYGGVKYKKSMWPLVRAFLEKNTHSGIEEFCRLLESRLSAESGAAPRPRKSHRHRRNTISASSQEAVVSHIKSPSASVSPPPPRAARPSPSPTLPWLRGALLLLLLLNALLYWRLFYSDREHNAAHLQDRIESVSARHMAEWSALLQRHANHQRGHMTAWREALDTTVHHLAKTEEAIRILLETVKRSAEQSQEQPTPRDDL